MKIESIDRKSIKVISESAMEALQMVAEDLGLKVEVKSGSFDPGAGTFTPKFVFSVEGSEQAAFARDCGFVWGDDGPAGLEPSDFGATFKSQGQTFTLVGVNLRAPKFPLLAKAEDGRIFKFKASAIKLIKLARIDAR